MSDSEEEKGGSGAYRVTHSVSLHLHFAFRKYATDTTTTYNTTAINSNYNLMTIQA
jgi:hypothetical protein